MAILSDNKFKIFGFFLLTVSLIVNLFLLRLRIKWWIDDEIPADTLVYADTIFEIQLKYFGPFFMFFVALQFFVDLLGFYAIKKVGKLPNILENVPSDFHMFLIRTTSNCCIFG
jgi:hypothetical protein